MKIFARIFFVFIFTFSFSISAFAEILLFWDKNCSYCIELNSYLEENRYAEKFQIQSFEITENKPNEAYFLQKSNEIGYTDLLLPLLIHNETYFDGTNKIVDYLQQLEGQFETLKNSRQEVSYLSSTDSKLLASIIEEEKSVEVSERKVEENQTAKTSRLNTGYILVFLIPLILAVGYWLVKKPKGKAS